jgi:hypothetical protein
VLNRSLQRSHAQSAFLVPCVALCWNRDDQSWDLYAGVMIVDLALAQFRLALSGDFELYTPISTLDQLASLRSRE